MVMMTAMIIRHVYVYMNIRSPGLWHYKLYFPITQVSVAPANPRIGYDVRRRDSGSALVQNWSPGYTYTVIKKNLC